MRLRITKFERKVRNYAKASCGNRQQEFNRSNLIALRKKHHLSQRALAHELQLKGYDIDKNVITRIETQQRFVTDIEIQAFCELFHITFEELINPNMNLMD